MKLKQVAHRAAMDAIEASGASLGAPEVEKITAIIANAMESAVQEASKSHADACHECLGHDQDLAHKLQQEIERKKIILIANLSSLR